MASYHAQLGRDAYTINNQSLFAEAMEGLDATVDFTRYDADRNGVTDGESLGCLTIVNSSNGATGQVATLIHETGHVLGLPDYCAYGGTTSANRDILTDDIMFNSTGDQNAFSKWTLGWIPDQNVTRVSAVSGAGLAAAAAGRARRG